MSPRRSHRDQLIEGALSCFEHKSYGEITARDIASAAGANLASIGYHFGSTSALLAQALAEGFTRWVAEFATQAAAANAATPRDRVIATAAAVRTSVDRHRGFALAYLEALARAPRDEQLRTTLADSDADSRSLTASMLGLGDDQAAQELAAVLIATFDGLIIQWLIYHDRAIRDIDLVAAFERLGQIMTARTVRPTTALTQLTENESNDLGPLSAVAVAFD